MQTVDFFTPIVDDPFAYGQIAAANALSDVYAMGGRPLTALNIMGIPEELVPPGRDRGHPARRRDDGAAGGLRAGGRAYDSQPGADLWALGHGPRCALADDDQRGARPGDLLVLTKPLGTGIVTTGIKRGLASAALAKRAIALMTRLNRAGAEVAERGLVRAGVDVTGFGLLGHLGSMCRASGVGAEIDARAVPAIGREVWELIAAGCVPGGTRQNLATAGEFTDFGAASQAQQILLADAQTSGGLLLCVPPKALRTTLDLLKEQRTVCAAMIGEIVKGKKRIRIRP